MEVLFLFILYYIIFFGVYKLYFLIKLRKGKQNLFKMTEILYLINIYKLDIKKIGIRKVLNIISLINPLILASILLSTDFIDNLLIRIIVMFVLLFILIIVIYHVIGKHFQKKGMIMNV
jgi:hypothetical protein